MRKIIEDEGKDILIRMIDIGPGAHDYQYYQGRLDSLAWVLRQLPDEEGE